MVKFNNTAGQSKNKLPKEDLIAIQAGETLREVGDRLGLSNKEAWKVKQAREKELRAIRISEKKEVLTKAAEKKSPASSKKTSIEKEKGVQIFPL